MVFAAGQLTELLDAVGANEQLDHAEQKVMYLRKSEPLLER